jgi:CRP-like cAMP-binding protein
MQGDLFDQQPIFQGLTPVQYSRLQSLFTISHYPVGSVIFEQGEYARYLYLVAEGEITIRFKPDDGPALVVARVRSGGVVGWSAALGSPSYTSGAVCAADCLLLRASGGDLQTLCEEDPVLGSLLLDRLATVIAQRLSNTHNHVITLLEKGLHLKHI